MIRNRNQKAAKGRGPRQNPRKPNGATRRSSAMAPVQFESNVRSHHRYRFTATAAATTTFTDSSVVACLGSVCTATNSTVVSVFRSFRIKRIEVWSAPASQGANSTCSVEWFGFGNSPNIEFSDTTLSVSKNAHISCTPPANSLAAFWQKATGVGLFILTVPAGSIVDMIVDTILNDEDGANQVVAVATGTLGNSYYLALDQQLGTHNFVPISLNTTF